MKYSFSSLSTYSRCPRLFWYVYVQGIRRPPPFAIEQGLAWHTGLERAHRMLVASRAASPKEITDFIAEAAIETSNPKKIVAGAVRTAPVYHERVYSHLRPTEVEQRFEVAFGQHTLVGVVDLKEGSTLWELKVRDYVPKEVLKRDPQLCIYATALSGVETVGHITLVPRRGIVKQEIVQVSDEELLHTNAWVSDVVKAIEVSQKTNHWPRCLRGSWHCSEKFCAFYRACYPQGVGDDAGVVAPWVEDPL